MLKLLLPELQLDGGALGTLKTEGPKSPSKLRPPGLTVPSLTTASRLPTFPSRPHPKYTQSKCSVPLNRQTPQSKMVVDILY